MSKFCVSCIQTNSTSDPIINIKKTLVLIKKAMIKKTDLICLPECVGILTDNKKKLDSLVLSNYLDKYAATGAEYTKVLKKIIEQNNLTDFDDVKLLPSSIQLKSLI